MEIAFIVLCLVQAGTVAFFVAALKAKDAHHDGQVKHLLNRITDPIGAMQETREVEMTPPAQLRPVADDDPYWTERAAS